LSCVVVGVTKPMHRQAITPNKRERRKEKGKNNREKKKKKVWRIERKGRESK
jgi:hypothetical protein